MYFKTLLLIESVGAESGLEGQKDFKDPKGAADGT